MAVSFANVNSEAGLKKLDEYLLTHSYITGYVILATLFAQWHNLCTELMLLSLATKLPRMIWLSTLHFRLLPHPSIST